MQGRNCDIVFSSSIWVSFVLGIYLAILTSMLISRECAEIIEVLINKLINSSEPFSHKVLDCRLCLVASGPDVTWNVTHSKWRPVDIFARSEAVRQWLIRPAFKLGLVRFSCFGKWWAYENRWFINISGDISPSDYRQHIEFRPRSIIN